MARQREYTELSPQPHRAQPIGGYQTSATWAYTDHSVHSGQRFPSPPNTHLHPHPKEMGHVHPHPSETLLAGYAGYRTGAPEAEIRTARTGDGTTARFSMDFGRARDGTGGMQRWTGHDPILNIDPILNPDPILKKGSGSNRTLRRNQTESDVYTRTNALTRSPLHTTEEEPDTRRPVSVQAHRHTEDTDAQSGDEIQFNRPHLRTDGVMDMATLTALRNLVDMHARRLK
ncbi:hypothetical protein SARC_12322, partial [Sphaeroforma arctica JP610]